MPPSVMKIEIGDMTDYYYDSRGQEGFGKFCGFKFDGHIAHVRQDKQGNVSRLLIKDGSSLFKNSKEIVKAGHILSNFEMKFTEEILEIKGPCNIRLKVYAAGATTVLFNGTRIRFHRIGEYIIIEKKRIACS